MFYLNDEVYEEAAKIGVPKSAVQSRYRYGWSKEEIVTTPYRCNRGAEHLLPEDYAQAERNGINRSTVYQRFYGRGHSKEKSINIPYRKQLSGNREFYEENKELAQVNFEQFLSRVLSKDSRFYQNKMKALITPIEKRNRIPDSIHELRKKNGISLKTFKVRIYNYRWDIMRAATEPIHTEKRKKARA